LHECTKEDGPIESTTAVFFGFSSVGFFIVAIRSQFLKTKAYGLRYFMTIAWFLLMLIFAGEEISWGQRIFGFEAPENISTVNLQDEFNIHNIEVVDTFLGGKYRYLSIMMITTGLLLPLLALTQFGKRIIRWFAFPVSPLAYWLLFVGAYVYGKYYFSLTVSTNDAAEVREFLMSVGMLCFSIHGAIRPCTVFRICNNK